VSHNHAGSGPSLNEQPLPLTPAQAAELLLTHHTVAVHPLHLRLQAPRHLRDQPHHRQTFIAALCLGTLHRPRALRLHVGLDLTERVHRGVEDPAPLRPGHRCADAPVAVPPVPQPLGGQLEGQQRPALLPAQTGTQQQLNEGGVPHFCPRLPPGRCHPGAGVAAQPDVRPQTPCPRRQPRHPRTHRVRRPVLPPRDIHRQRVRLRPPEQLGERGRLPVPLRPTDPDRVLRGPAPPVPIVSQVPLGCPSPRHSA
jgi:hypothetical protein